MRREMESEICECGTEVTYCSLCGRSRFHVTVGSMRISGCALCDTMTRWPSVIAAPDMARAVYRQVHPSQSGPGPSAP